MVQDSEYKPLATIAVYKQVMMPTTYLAEKGFSALVNTKNKKRNRLKMVNELMGIAEIVLFNLNVRLERYKENIIVQIRLKKNKTSLKRGLSD